jgi:hypothetical protein
MAIAIGVWGINVFFLVLGDYLLSSSMFRNPESTWFDIRCLEGE